MRTSRGRTRARIITPTLGLPSLPTLRQEERQRDVRAWWRLFGAICAAAVLADCGGGSRCVVTGYAPALIAGRLVVVEAQRCAEVEQ